MTVCIAALCDDRKAMVLAADMMIGMQFVEAELTAGKINWVHKDWRILLAGDDIAPAFEIIDAVKNAFSKRRSETIPVRDVMETVGGIYRTTRMRKYESLYLSSRGWSTDKFVKTGLKNLPPALFQSIDYQIQNFDLGVSLLVAGFGSKQTGEVFTVENPGVVSKFTMPGFHAIGSGSINALSNMYYRELTPKMTLAEMLYYVFEAKVSGEAASGVGTKTDLVLVKAGKKGIHLKLASEKTLEKVWRQMKPREMSPAKRKVLDNLEKSLVNQLKNAT